MVESKNLQPEINIGLVGHVDHGKTSLLERLSGVWADTHSEEIKRGITIRLGYANTSFYYCKECKLYCVKEVCKCNGKCSLLRIVSFIDAPGHETLMATMLSGAAIMDGALLLIAANEKCPQPQTREHLMALEMIGVRNIVIVQNKIDLVTKEEALKNYKEIKEFIKGSIAENSEIIPISAQHNVNINEIVRAIEENIKTPKRDETLKPLFYVARSFDVNKPGGKIDNLIGGVLGGALKQGVLKIGDKILIRPGFREKDKWNLLTTEIVGIMSGKTKIEYGKPGGSLALLTMLDPSLVKSDSLIGNVVSLEDNGGDVFYELKLKIKLLERVVGSKEELKVEDVKKNETLMLNVNSAATIGIVFDIKKDIINVRLKIPVCAEYNDRVTISRMIGSRWRLIGIGSIVK